MQRQTDRRIAFAIVRRAAAAMVAAVSFTQPMWAAGAPGTIETDAGGSVGDGGPPANAVLGLTERKRSATGKSGEVFA